MLKIVIITSCFYYLLIVLHKIKFFINSHQYKNPHRKRKKNLNKQNRVTIRKGQKYFLVIFAVLFISRQ